MDIFWGQKKLGNQIQLSPEESKHIVRSLRKKSGDRITIMMGEGIEYLTVIRTASKDEVIVDIEKTIEHSPPPYFLTIAISPLKNENRLEWFVEKAVEIGVTEIIPIRCIHTVKPTIRKDRLERIIQSACKQSREFFEPKIRDVKNITDFLKSDNSEEKYIAYVPEDNITLTQAYQGGQDVSVVIGPEGGFGIDEINLALEYGYRAVSLGSKRLRSETAGVAACQIIKSKYEIL